MRCRLTLVLLLVFVVSSCGGGEVGEGSPASTSTAVSTVVTETTEAASVEPSPGSYPYGLSAASMPEGQSGLIAVFDEMPGELAGLSRRSDDYGLAAQYGDLNGLFAVEFAPEVGGPSLLEMVSAFDQEPSAVIDASQLDPEADLVWVFGSFKDQGGAGVVHMAMWGEPGGDCMFSVNAATPEMRKALVEAYLGAVAVDVAPSAEGDALDELRQVLLTQAEIGTLLGVPDISADVVGGLGVGDPEFEHFAEQPVGGYFVMFRNPAGMPDSGSLALSLFKDAAAAAAAVAESLGVGAPDAEMLRAEFDVGDVFAQGAGYVLDPEPDSHFTRFIGRIDSTVVTLMVFHGPDDDRVAQAQAITTAIGERLKAMN